MKDIKTEGHKLQLSCMGLEDGDMNLVVELAEAQGKTKIDLCKFKVTSARALSDLDNTQVGDTGAASLASGLAGSSLTVLNLCK